MIERIEIENFKALKALDIALRPLTVVVGPNASGKTSLLEALWLVSQLGLEHPDADHHVFSRPGVVMQEMGGPQRLRTVGATGAITIAAWTSAASHLKLTAEIEPKPQADSIEPSTPPSATAEEFYLGLRVTLTAREIDGAETSIRFPAPAGQMAGRAFFARPAVQAIAPGIMLRLDARELAQPWYSDDEVPHLHADGRGLAAVVAWLAAADSDRLKAIEADLQQIVPRTGRIRTPRAEIVRHQPETFVFNDAGFTRTVERRYWGNRLEIEFEGAGFIPADLVSEGTLLVLGLLTALHSPTCPQLVLLDDADRALHPRAQWQLIECLRRMQKRHAGLQIICTTHSPLLLDSFDDDDEVLAMGTTEAGHAVCRPLTAHPEWPRWKGMMKMGEFWSGFDESWMNEADALRHAE